MSDTATKYFTRLKEKMHELADDGSILESDLNDLNQLTGASESDIGRLKEAYPSCPELLIEMLKYVNGTYWRAIPNSDREAAVAVLASMDYRYPHYLLSVDQIIADRANEESLVDAYGDDIADLMEIDPRIDPSVPEGEWLHFTDCVNNGGTSRLYIDFSPAADGTKGQIIEYVHDPDEYTVIAESFDEYIQEIMDLDFPFIEEE